MTQLIRNFKSSLAAPTLIVPTRKKQCKRGGWRDYPQFKNQGQCVRFVVTGKPPRGSGPGPAVGYHPKAHGRQKHAKPPK